MSFVVLPHKAEKIEMKWIRLHTLTWGRRNFEAWL